jgi:cob(I)alamin adenosyltransferase
MKIYTKTGDDGSTGLFGGGRVPKSDPRIECYGTVDEMNATLGLAAAGGVPGAGELVQALHAVQCDLFVIGAHLATPEDSPYRSSLPPLDQGMSTRLEGQIDAAESQLSPLRQFILPGGSETAARLHLARTICRRAERLLVSFAASHPVDPALLIYLNRLSDWLFVQARLANHRAGVADVPWGRGGVA